jgi:hypothetical protein
VNFGSGSRWARWLAAGCVLAALAAAPIVLAWGKQDPVRAVLVGADAGGGGAGSPAVAAEAPPAPRTGLAQQAVSAAQAAAAPNTQLSVAVFDRVTGETAVGERGSEPYYTASLAKIVVAVDMVDRRREDGLKVSAADLGLLQRALSASDDSAMNALWVKFDGQGAAGRVSKRLQLTGTTAPDDPSQWGQMSVPAVDFVRIWRYLLDEMPAVDRQLLVGDMKAAPATARDGFNQAFGLLSPAVREPEGVVAKQGWMCCFSKQYYLHSAGVLGPDERFVVVLLSRQPRSAGWDAARGQLDDVATAAVRSLH